MASLEYTYADYYKRISRYLGTGTTPTGTALTDAQDIFHRAYRQFLYPAARTGSNTWSFMNKPASFNVASGTTTYIMPTDYGSMSVDFTYTLQDNKLVSSLRYIDEASMTRMLAFNAGNGEPLYYTISQDNYNQTSEQRHNVTFYPIPNGNYTFAYQYNVNPPKLSADTDRPMGGPECCECLMQMCLAAAELQEDGVQGPQEAKAQELLAATISADKDRNSAATVGYNGDKSENVLTRLPPGFVTGDPRVRGFNFFP